MKHKSPHGLISDLISVASEMSQMKKEEINEMKQNQIKTGKCSMYSKLNEKPREHILYGAYHHQFVIGHFFCIVYQKINLLHFN